ncbi:MAG TPA: guanylate kinase [Flavobacteriales bacterium]|nr:guanylate kinase [Flavobacteriales bacterium]
MNSGKCIIFSAPSGAGKTSIVRHLLKVRNDLEFSVSACTREQRPDEVDGKDYYFLSPAEFKRRIDRDEFIEWEEVYQDQFYGTLKSEIDRIWRKGKHVIFDVDVKGGLSLTRYFKENALAIFVKAPSVEALERRLRSRGTETDEKIARRLAKASQELDYAKWFDLLLLNDNFETACKEAEIMVNTFISHI